MIYYFSATGNCKHIAEAVAVAAGTQAVSMENVGPVGTDDAVLGIVTPTYAFGLPVIVKDFLRKIRSLKKPDYFFFVATYGTTCGFTKRQAEKIVSVKFDAAFSVKMPDTWTPQYDLSDPEKVRRILDAAERETNDIRTKIANREKGNFMKDTQPYITSLFALPYYEIMRKTKHFQVNDACVGCRLCEKKCPYAAIAVENGKPVWKKKKCVMCLRCLHNCPKQAISYGKNTTKHGQYTYEKASKYKTP